MAIQKNTDGKMSPRNYQKYDKFFMVFGSACNMLQNQNMAVKDLDSIADKCLEIVSRVVDKFSDDSEQDDSTGSL